MQGGKEGLESSWESYLERQTWEWEGGMSWQAVASRWRSGFQAGQPFTQSKIIFISITGPEIKF